MFMVTSAPDRMKASLNGARGRANLSIRIAAAHAERAILASHIDLRAVADCQRTIAIPADLHEGTTPKQSNSAAIAADLGNVDGRTNPVDSDLANRALPRCQCLGGAGAFSLSVLRISSTPPAVIFNMPDDPLRSANIDGLLHRCRHQSRSCGYHSTTQPSNLHR